MSNYPKISHVIFDLDGLLIDSEKTYTDCTNDYLEKFGKTFGYDVKSKMMGKRPQEAAQILIDEYQLPITAKEYMDHIQDYLTEMFPKVGLLPGADKLVRHLDKHNIPICIATGSDKSGFDLKIQGHPELFKLFHHAVLCGSDPEVANAKPAPDCFLVAAQRFPDKPPPEKILVFEDAVNGVKAAHAANMSVVWVPAPEANKDELRDKATVIFDSLEEFKPEDFGLPSYDS